jgi:peptidoglycan/xylan/chitin deacetylase (PgdA/CDA1 family)
MALLSADTRKHLVRESFDLLRSVERVASPSLHGAPWGFRGRSFAKADIVDPFLSITFDDGPHPENTPRLLDTLADRGVKATFYLIGREVARYPELARRIKAEGHEIGSHTFSHRFLTTQTGHSIARELTSTHSAISAAIGEPPTTLRPPYGAVTEAMTRWIDHQFGYPTVLWSLSAADWEDPGADLIADRLVEGARPGSVILNHDIYAPTVHAMPETLDRLLDKGFRFATVSDLMVMDRATG